MKIAVIRIGTMHARNLAQVTEVDEVLLHDLVPGGAQDAADRLGDGFTACSSLEEALDRADGVVIATNTSTHAEVLRSVVAAGIPALLEKPIASDLATMTELVEYVEAQGATVLVGFKHRIDTGEMGDVLIVRATGCDATPPDPAYLPTSGGIFRDLLIHDLDAVPWLVGQRVVEGSAQGSVLVDQMFGTRLNPVGYDHRVEVLGSRDSLAVGLSDPEHTPLAFLGSDGRTVAAEPFTCFPTRFAPAYAAEMEAFCDVIAGRRDNPSPVRDSLLSLELAEACEQSRRCGTPVRNLSATSLRPRAEQVSA